jgi:hypothetical protein
MRFRKTQTWPRWKIETLWGPLKSTQWRAPKTPNLNSSLRAKIPKRKLRNERKLRRLIELLPLEIWALKGLITAEAWWSEERTP